MPMCWAGRRWCPPGHMQNNNSGNKHNCDGALTPAPPHVGSARRYLAPSSYSSWERASSERSNGSGTRYYDGPHAGESLRGSPSLRPSPRGSADGNPWS